MEILDEEFCSLNDHSPIHHIEYRIKSLDSIEKKPSTSELVDWLRALELGGVDPARIAKDIPFAGVLLKKDKDITAMQRRMR